MRTGPAPDEPLQSPAAAVTPTTASGGHQRDARSRRRAGCRRCHAGPPRTRAASPTAAAATSSMIVGETRPVTCGFCGKRFELRQDRAEQSGQQHHEQRRSKHQRRRARCRARMSPAAIPAATPWIGVGERGDDHRSDHRRRGVTDDTGGGHHRREHQEQPETALLGAHVADEEIHRLADLLGRARLIGEVLAQLPRHIPCLQRGTDETTRIRPIKRRRAPDPRSARADEQGIDPTRLWRWSQAR